MRSCDGCNECCYELRIKSHHSDERVFVDSKSRSACEYMCEGGCSAYERRPYVCEGYQCYWLQGGLRDTDRPDLSGVLVDLDHSWAPHITTYIVTACEGLNDQSSLRTVTDQLCRSIAQYERRIVVTVNEREKISEFNLIPEDTFSEDERESIYNLYLYKIEGRKESLLEL